MTTQTENEVSVTIDFDDAAQAIAYLSGLLDWMKNQSFDDASRTQVKHIKTAKEICEAFCCEHFQKELRAKKMTQKVQVWINDDQGGAFPIFAELKRDGDCIALVHPDISFKLRIDDVLMLVSDEQHG